MNVLYTAAHSGFDLTRVPLGGGATVCRHLVDVWRETAPFSFQLIGPSFFSSEGVDPHRLVDLSERAYAGFCRRFERQTTAFIRKQSARDTVVLCNDISEGPDFRGLAEAGYPIYTIYHVDVVDYVCRLYLREIIRPETLTRAYAWLTRHGCEFIVPDLLKLIVQKQQDSVLYSRGLIVPSAAMKGVLLRCYPYVDPAKIHVLPWGIWTDPVERVEVAQAHAALQNTLRIPQNAVVLLTLSRISPEKGQDRLLKALALWENSAEYPREGVVLLIAGEPAYMQGRRFLKRLQQLTRRLRRTRVTFVGYAAGARKQALFERATLYVFPSRHESYGLTLLEAMQAGLPSLACDDHGTREIMRPEFGMILPPTREPEISARLAQALSSLLADRPALKAMGERARTWALGQPFFQTAARLAELLARS